MTVVAALLAVAAAVVVAGGAPRVPSSGAVRGGDGSGRGVRRSWSRGAAAGAVVRRWRRRHAEVGDARLAGALEAVAASLRSGASVPAAVADAAAGPGADVGFVELHERVVRGCPFEVALREWAEVAAAPGSGLAAAVLSLAVDLGGRAAEAVDGVVATLRARGAAAGEVRAMAAQAAASVAVLLGAPVAFGALAATSDARVAAYFVSPTGLACVAGAVLLDLAGGWWMLRLVRGVLR